MTVRVEIAVQDISGVRIASDCGANRVEVCSALSVGGLTPSAGLIDLAAREEIGVHPLIRSRAGGFIFTPDEIDVMKADIETFAQLGADGVVVGALTEDNTIDTDALKVFKAAAGDMSVTFHRAFDIVQDPRRALETLIDAGVTRVLTSGQAPKAIEGIDLIRALVEQAKQRINIQAGGGVAISDIPALVAAGVRDIHLSARASASDAGPAGPGGGEGSSYDVTDESTVREAMRAVRTSQKSEV